jgi:hypothetical protein
MSLCQVGVLMLEYDTADILSIFSSLVFIRVSFHFGLIVLLFVLVISYLFSACLYHSLVTSSL